MNKADIREKMMELAKAYSACIRAEKKEKSYIPASGKDLGAEELCNMIDASLDLWLTTGRFNDQFESKFAEKLSTEHALTTNSGSSANLLAMSALLSPKLGERALKPGDEVIAVAAGFPTTVNPIIQCGLVPVFVDCVVGTYNVDAELIEAAIGPRTKAIFLAHTLGNMYDMDKVMALSRQYGLWIIEDSCDALGARYKNKFAGTIGHIGTFSFYPAHHITMGEGGAVVTDDPLLHRIVMSIRDWGRDCWCKPGRDDTCHRRFQLKSGNLPLGYDHKYTYSHIGYNLKITDWQAAIGLAQLDKLDGFLERRRRNAEILLRQLSDLQDYLVLPSAAPNCTPSWFGFLITVREKAPFTKQELVEYLESHGVGTRQLFAGNILRQPMIVSSNIKLRIGNSGILNSTDLTEDHYKLLPGTEYIMNNTFWVGVAQNLNELDVGVTARTIRDFIEGRTK